MDVRIKLEIHDLDFFLGIPKVSNLFVNELDVNLNQGCVSNICDDVCIHEDDKLHQNIKSYIASEMEFIPFTRELIRSSCSAENRSP